MNCQIGTVSIICGEKGLGKTTYAMQKWSKNLFVACGDPLNQIKSTGALFFALQQIYNSLSDDLGNLVMHLRKAIQDGYTLIVDEAEKLNDSLLKIIVNTALSHKDNTIVFIFDIGCEAIFESKIFRLLVDWNYISTSEKLVNFRADISSLEAIIENALPEVKQRMKEELLEASDHNFNNLKRLLWLIINKQHDTNQISKEVIAEYSYYLVEGKLSSLPADLIDILKKSSIIGEMFQSCILESPDGFCVLGVKSYLRKLEATNMFIQSYLSEKIYRFLSSKIHLGVFESIEPREKVESQKILMHYYLTRLSLERNVDKKLEYLLQLKRLAHELNEYRIMLFADKKLLYQYSQIKDIEKAREILEDLLPLCRQLNDDKLYRFLFFYAIRLDLSVGKFGDALNQIEKVKIYFPYDRNAYLQYFNARSLFGVGNIDAAYSETKDLVKMLKISSGNSSGQQIYALAYSLLATIQNHLGIDDLGAQYYALALNHSRYRLDEQYTYFEILKKCDMYYPLAQTYPLMIQCITFFKKMGRKYDAAQACINLATEIMFHYEDCAEEAATYFHEAIAAFSNMPNENLAYSQNNYALFCIIVYGDFSTAQALLEQSLFVGMSDFTYMTIYLNLCMCYLKNHGYNSVEVNRAYKLFCKHYSRIKARKYATQYEDTYKELLDIIILEHKGDSQCATVRAKKICDQNPAHFFRPILMDIMSRNVPNHGHSVDTKYSENSALYSALNRHKVFLADFRFWE